MKVEWLILGGAAVIGLAGCSTGAGRSAAPGLPTSAPRSAPTVAPPSVTTPTTVASPKAATTPPAPASTVAVPATSTTAATTVPTCPAAGLAVTLQPPLGSAGAEHYRFVLRNTSRTRCRLYGFPGVSFLDASGAQIGPAAQRGTAVTPQPVTLAPGASGYARLDVTDPGIPPCAGPGTVTTVRVYPPASFAAVMVAPPAGPMYACISDNTADYIASTVGPVTSSPGP